MTKELGNEIVQHVGQRLKRDYAVDQAGLPLEIVRGLQRLQQREEALSKCRGGEPGDAEGPAIGQQTGLAAHVKSVETRMSKPSVD